LLRTTPTLLPYEAGSIAVDASHVAYKGPVAIASAATEGFSGVVERSLPTRAEVSNRKKRVWNLGRACAELSPLPPSTLVTCAGMECSTKQKRLTGPAVA